MAQQYRYQEEQDICKYYHLHDKKLGEGGFAKVRLATHLVTKQLVAIKVLDKIKLDKELPRIYNEIKCLKKLRHKNIARLYQVFETPTVIYLVLEFCSGGELFDYIVKRSRLDESEAAQVVYDLMKVLDFIHINGFAHRDLKPENVLFDDKRQIKLIDFGLAANCSPDNMATNKSQAPMGQLSTCCGSITYAAPEIISGGSYSGTAVDVWSAGVLMYACLVGQLPFNDDSISKLYQKIRAGIQDLPRFLTPDACDLLRRMLTVNPKHRITVRDVLTHPWLRNRAINVSRITRRLDFNNLALDERVVRHVCEKFPNIPEAQLKDYIRLDFNYYSTAYHLLQSKCPHRSVAVKRTPDQLNTAPPASNNSQRYQSPAAAPAMVLNVEASNGKRHHNFRYQILNNQYGVERDTNQHTILTTTPKGVRNFNNAPHTPGRKDANVSPTKRARFLTVTKTPKTPRTPPSYLRRLHESTNTTPMTAPSKLTLVTMSKFKPTPKKSLVKRLLASATPKKLLIRSSKSKRGTEI